MFVLPCFIAVLKKLNVWALLSKNLLSPPKFNVHGQAFLPPLPFILPDSTLEMLASKPSGMAEFFDNDFANSSQFAFSNYLVMYQNIF